MPGASGGAHQSLVAAVVDAGNVEARRQAFSAIGRNFPSSLLSSFSARPPYYCHFMQWRLATLGDAQLQRVDQLLECAESVPRWRTERQSLLHSPDFAEFWSLVWQMQVAEYLRARGFDLEWGGNKGGPDLSARRGSEILFVECLAARKFFAAILFLEEILGRLHPRLRVHHQLFLRITLPSGETALDAFFDALVRELEAPGRLDTLASQANHAWPVVVPLPLGASNLTVYLEGDDLDAYQPGVLPFGGGDPEKYLALILREAISNKQRANGLRRHHPNVLAVNFLLGDHQLVMRVAAPTAPDLRGVIDELVCATIGIDDAIRPQQIFRIDRATESFVDWTP